MDFARAHMRALGWSEGSGLGRPGGPGGIVQPVRPVLKFDTVGLGCRPFSDVCDAWWSRLYDRAAERVRVRSDNIADSSVTSDTDAQRLMTSDSASARSMTSEVSEVVTDDYDVSLKLKNELIAPTMPVSKKLPRSKKSKRHRQPAVGASDGDELRGNAGGGGGIGGAASTVVATVAGCGYGRFVSGGVLVADGSVQRVTPATSNATSNATASATSTATATATTANTNATSTATATLRPSAEAEYASSSDQSSSDDDDWCRLKRSRHRPAVADDVRVVWRARRRLPAHRGTGHGGVKHRSGKLARVAAQDAALLAKS